MSPALVIERSILAHQLETVCEQNQIGGHQINALGVVIWHGVDQRIGNNRDSGHWARVCWNGGESCHGRTLGNETVNGFDVALDSHFSWRWTATFSQNLAAA